MTSLFSFMHIDEEPSTAKPDAQSTALVDAQPVAPGATAPPPERHRPASMLHPAAMPMASTTMPLFSIDLGFADHLDAEQLTDGLRTEFQNNGHFLAAGATIAVRQAELEWAIHNAGTEYLIQRGVLDLSVFSLTNAPAQDMVLAEMLSVLNGFLTPGAAPLPAPSVSVISVTERPVGLGNLRGFQTRGSFSAIALKGGRLDTVVRFQIWDNEPRDVDAAVDALHGDLLSAKDSLWLDGFLQITASTSSVAEHVATLGIWRKTADYRVLYEYHYQDSDAESLIARIPIDIGGLFTDSTVITDDMVRWDNLPASALVVRSRDRSAVRIRELVHLSFLPDGWDGGGVTISATVNGITQEQSFATVRAFLDAFVSEAGTVQLGLNSYRAGRRPFPNADFPDPIELRGGDDTFQISYDATQFDSDAVVYLRALP